MMEICVSEVLEYLNNEGYNTTYQGNSELTFNSFCSLAELKSGAVTWIKKLESFNLDDIDDSSENLFITDNKYSGSKRFNVISCTNAKAAFFSILTRYFIEKEQSEIAETSVVLSKNISDGVSIGHNCYIGRDVSIGRGTIIRNNVIIECPTVIGEDCIIESGVVIGTAGYGYYEDCQKKICKVPDFGGVRIGNRVDIGANTCVARGTLDDTCIGDDVKIDNLCHIGHNVKINQHCYIVALTMLGGSAVIEKDAYIAPGAMVINQITVGKNSIVGMGAVVTKCVEENTVVAGVPAKVLRNK